MRKTPNPHDLVAPMAIGEMSRSDKGVAGLTKPLIFIFVICLTGHVYLALQLGLSVDEAHYALYAAYPALSYFDHPPLVGWLQIPFVWLGDSWGNADGLMRVVPLLLWGITAWALWRMAGRVSLWALILFLLSPIHHLLGLALVPDTLLLPLTLWVMLLTWKLSKAVLNDKACMRYWLWLGVALGLSGLSKYTGVFLAISCALILLRSHGLALLKQRGLWLAAVIAALMISPVLVWNAQNNWMSFTYQLNHAGGNQSWTFFNVFKFDLVQLLSYGALPLLGLVVFLWKLQSQHKRLMWLCLVFGLPTLLLATYSSGKGSALPHWTATGWLALMPLSALGLQHLWQGSAGYARKAAWVLICGLVFLQALSIAALGLLMATGGQWRGTSLFGERGNPFADLHGWQAASTDAKARHIANKTTAIVVSNWTLASRLAWYARPARVLTLDSKNKQFELWHGQLKLGDSAIWVNWSQMPFDAPVGRSLFETCSPLPTTHDLVAPMTIGEMSALADKGVVSEVGGVLVQPATPLSLRDISPTAVGANHISQQLSLSVPPLQSRGDVAKRQGGSFEFYHCTNWQGRP